MPITLYLRDWQRRALDALVSCGKVDFLAVATPGAGKTTFALAAVCQALGVRPSPVIVVAPTAHLKHQWAEAAERFGLVLDPSWAPRAGALPADVHGIVASYQQVMRSADALGALARDAVVVLDEIHHAGDERAWGEALRRAFSGASARLALSGTPFRSDRVAIPFVTYDDGLARADFEYGYGEALRDDGVVRPVRFPRVGGEMSWAPGDGTVQQASFDDPLARTRANQRLRAALSPAGEWLPAVLGAAHRRLGELRRAHPDAGGLVIASDVEHARAIAGKLAQRFGVRARLAISDDADASEQIAAFAHGSDPWLVAVRMVSEGVDIPRLRVGVYATTTTTELFFRQAVGRFVRHLPGIASQEAYLYIPDDARLRALAYAITETRRHSLASAGGEDEREAIEARAETVRAARDELRLFEVLSAVAHEQDADDGIIVVDDPGGVARAAPLGGDAAVGAAAHLRLELAPPPLPNGARPHDGAWPHRARRKELRERNALAARELAAVSGRSYAEVNAELNRAVGLRRIAEATLVQLEVRLEAAWRWRAALL